MPVRRRCSHNGGVPQDERQWSSIAGNVFNRLVLGFTSGCRGAHRLGTGRVLAEDANREAAELNESTASDDVVDPRNIMDDDNWNDEGFEIMETEDEKAARRKRKAGALAFSSHFAPVPAAIAKERKTRKIAPPEGVKVSRMKQGSRKRDVSKATLQKKVDPYHGLLVRLGGLWCNKCNCGVRSSATSSRLHKVTKKHLAAMASVEKSDNNSKLIQTALLELKETKEKGGFKVAGLQLVPVETQIFRAEVLEVFVAKFNGIEVKKLARIRPFLEKHAGHRLTDCSELASTYLKPLMLKEQKLLQSEHDGNLVNIHHDETTHNGESFAQIYRRISPNLDIILRAYQVAWLKGSLNSSQIGAVLVTGLTQHTRINMENVVAVHNDSVAVNVKVFRDTLRDLWIHCDMNLCLTHGGQNTYAKVETAVALDGYLAGFVKCISLSNFARSIYHSIFGEAPQKKSNTRWFSDAVVVSVSIYPGLDGRMLEFVTKLHSNSLCEASAGKMVAVHGNRRLFTMLLLEAAVVSIVGMACNTALQGDGFEFITGYSKIAQMETLLNNPVTPELKVIIDKIADQAPGGQWRRWM